MVCLRCIESVRQIFAELGVNVLEIQLGKVTITESITSEQKQHLQTKLNQKGFELLDDKNTKLINQIKSIIIQQIHHSEEAIPVNFSTLLTNQLHFDYTYLSRLFSSVEGRTIEQYILSQKIEKIKELLIYDELTLSEIAFQMHYSSPAYLSTQFKKITGMSPSAFRKMQNQQRRHLDEV